MNELSPEEQEQTKKNNDLWNRLRRAAHILPIMHLHCTMHAEKFLLRHRNPYALSPDTCIALEKQWQQDLAGFCQFKTFIQL